MPLVEEKAKVLHCKTSASISPITWQRTRAKHLINISHVGSPSTPSTCYDTKTKKLKRKSRKKKSSRQSSKWSVRTSSIVGPNLSKLFRLKRQLSLLFRVREYCLPIIHNKALKIQKTFGPLLLHGENGKPIYEVQVLAHPYQSQTHQICLIF